MIHINIHCNRKTANNQNLQTEKRPTVTYPPSGMLPYGLKCSYRLKHKPQKHNRERSQSQQAQKDENMQMEALSLQGPKM